MAPLLPASHAPAVPFTYDDGRPSAVQRGLPGVAREEEPLPSERVLRGELLDDRRREALVSIRRWLVDRPDGFTTEEWRVVVAVLAPPSGGGMAGVRSRAERVRVACECFPGYAAPAALRAFLAAAARPHVAEAVADFRALEAADVQEQRTLVREVLYNVMALATINGPADEEGNVGPAILQLALVDPGGAAKLASAAVAAAKALVDMDGLRAPSLGRSTPGGDDGPASGMAPEDPRASISDRIDRIAADLAARRAPDSKP